MRSKKRLSKRTMTEIPNKIHMVWVGSKPPPIIRQCITRAKAVNTSSDVIFWNKFPDEFLTEFKEQLKLCSQVCQAVDIFRLWLCYKHGGFYIDSDIWFHRDMSGLFVDGFSITMRSATRLFNGVMGSEAGNKNVGDVLNIIKNTHNKNLRRCHFGRLLLTPYYYKNKSEIVKMPTSTFLPITAKSQCRRFWRLDQKSKDRQLNNMKHVPYGVHLFGVLGSGKNKTRGKQL